MDEQATAGDVAGAGPALSKSAKKRLMKQQRLEARKAERKVAEKERRRQNLEIRRREWDEKLSSATEEDRARMVEERKGMRKERMDRRAEEREMRIQRLTRAKETGPKVVLDLEFSDLMSSGEVHSLVHQVRRAPPSPANSLFYIYKYTLFINSLSILICLKIYLL